MARSRDAAEVRKGGFLEKSYPDETLFCTDEVQSRVWFPSTAVLIDYEEEKSTEEQLMKELMEVIPFRQEEIKIFGKLVKEPRLCAWYGGAYKYSGRALKENPLDSVPQLASLRDRISRKLDLDLNSVLINLYRDGSDYIGWHSDDERELGPSKDDIVVASLSLGAARDFRLKRKDGAGNPISITLESGSLLIMRGETQKLWKHMVPKTKNVQQPRINLTFRFLHQVSTGSPTPKDGQTKRAIVRT